MVNALSISIPALTHRLRTRAENVGARPPSYTQVASRVRDGAIPAMHDGKQWWVKTEDETRAAELFGLAEPVELARTKVVP